MYNSLSRDEIRALDKKAIEEYGLPGVVLMENAGRGIAAYLLSKFLSDPSSPLSSSKLHPNTPSSIQPILQPNLSIHLQSTNIKPSEVIKPNVLICCGKGNNGGDGYVVARYLDIHQIPCRVLVFADPDEIQGDAKIHYDVIKKSGIPITYYSSTNEKNSSSKSERNHAEPGVLKANMHFEESLLQEFTAAEWLVDGIFGTGLKGQVNDFYAKIINLMNQSKTKILSIDIPSGLDCDTGEPLGLAIRAHTTISLIAVKKGFANPAAKQYIGDLEIIDLGLPRILYPHYSKNH